MQRRLLIALVTSLVYVATYAALMWFQSGAIDGYELGLSGATFFLVFFLLGSWLDRRRYQKKRK
jgi:hypothetical protein